MIRSLLKIGFILVIGILIYNYFKGTPEEQATSEKIFGQARSLVGSVGQMISSEKQKFDAGKYDAALDKLGGAYRTIRNQAGKVDDKLMTRLDELEQRRLKLETELSEINKADQSAATPPPKGAKIDPKTKQTIGAKVVDQEIRKQQLQQKLQQLIDDSDKLMQQGAQK